jgi:hypothetical protein
MAFGLFPSLILCYQDSMVSQDKKISKNRGRPATGTNPTVGVRLPPDILNAIEEWRALQRPIPSVPESIRALLKKALRL